MSTTVVSLSLGVSLFRKVLLLLVALLATLPVPAGEESGAARRAAVEPDLSEEALRNHVAFLASDELRGRQVGSPGIVAAEEYIIEAFRAARLRPLPGLTGYAHRFEVTRHGYSREGSSLEVQPPSQEGPGGSPQGGAPDASPRFFRAGGEMRPLPFSGEGSVSGPLVFTGYGIVGAGRDDYADSELQGAVALVLRGEPVVDEVTSPFYGEEFTRHAYFSTKAERAYAAGASALVVVDVPGRRDEGRAFATVPSFILEESPPPLPPELTADVPEGFLAVHVESSLLELLAQERGKSIEELVAASDRGEPPVGPLSRFAAVRVQKAEPQRVRARNIVGLLPAEGARRRGSRETEVVIIAAHHDHLGAVYGPGDSVYNGADDNASGVATLLEIARLLSQRPREVEILFVTFSAEEYGLLGARSFLESGLIDPPRVRAMVNFDMVGRNPEEPPRIYHNRRGPLGALPFNSIADSLGIEAQVETADRAPSDQLVFHRAGTPTILFFTGLHDDYHGLDDEAAAIDPRRHREVTELAYAVISELVQPTPR